MLYYCCTFFTMGYIKPLIRDTKIKRNGKFPIELRVTIKRFAHYVSIGVDVEKKHWDSLKSRLKKSYSNSVRTNNLIAHYSSKAEDYIVEKETKGEIPNIKDLREIVFNKHNTNISIEKVAWDYIDDLELQKKYKSLASSRSRVKMILEFFNPKLGFSQITEASLNKYKIFLMSKYNHSDRTIVNHFILIRSLYNRAIKSGVANANEYPFGERGLSIKMPESQKIGLDRNEVELIEGYAPKSFTTMWNARNLFLFSFYVAGARVSDVLNMQWTNIKKDRLYYVMGKNSKVVSIKLTDKALAIISFYKKRRKVGEKYVFPELNNCIEGDEQDKIRKINTATKKFNKWLGVMAEALNIDKKITCHVARHTFGNLSGDTIPIQMLQKLYRHSSITTTVSYQQAFMNRDTDDALDKVLNGDN
jgi:integrase/recombinase XerD